MAKRQLSTPIDQKIFNKMHDLCKLLKVRQYEFLEKSLQMYIDHIENNPPCISEHAEIKLKELIAENQEQSRTIDDLKARLSIVELQIKGIYESK